MRTRRPVRPALTVLALRLTAMSVLLISLLTPVGARAASCPPEAGHWRWSRSPSRAEPGSRT